MAKRTRRSPPKSARKRSSRPVRPSGRAKAKRSPKQKPASSPEPQTRSAPTGPAGAGGTTAFAWRPAAGEAGIRIRMYRVGFGDFFLVSLNRPGSAPAHLIIDCGVFKGTSQTGDIGTIEAAVANMAQETAGEVALIVMTHRHADHIAGFGRCADTFKALKVEAVWMPIWESEYSPVAMKFQAELTRTAVALRQHLTSLGAAAAEEYQTARKYMENATGESGKGSNAAALNVLKHSFTGVTPQYYQGGNKPELPKTLADAGLTATVLGPPPIADLDLMKLMDLQKGVGQYLAATGAADGSVDGAPLDPFEPSWEVDPFTRASSHKSTQIATEGVREFVGPTRRSWGPVSLAEASQARLRLERVIEQSQPTTALTAAKQLNSFLNNQSLVILFEFGGKPLLFVGDAQGGNWEHWLFDTDKPDKQGTGTVVSDAASILSSISFYKVGHHGSGNATPKAALAAMGDHARAFAAMCSTEAGVYGTEDPDDPTKGTEVPRIPLLQKLASEAALVRSDQIEAQLTNNIVKPAVTAALPKGGQGFRFEEGAFWVDCFL